MTRIPLSKFREAETERAGWCPTCLEFVAHGRVEPDGEAPCEHCGGLAIGLMAAVMLHAIDVELDEGAHRGA
jgi:hypothetical protein